MVPSIEKAHFVNGRTQKVMAAECGVGDRQWYKWMTGRSRCPRHRRQSVDRAFGVPVDWAQYDREVDALLGPGEVTTPPMAVPSAPQAPQSAPQGAKSPGWGAYQPKTEVGHQKPAPRVSDPVADYWGIDG